MMKIFVRAAMVLGLICWIVVLFWMRNTPESHEAVHLSIVITTACLIVSIFNVTMRILTIEKHYRENILDKEKAVQGLMANDEDAKSVELFFVGLNGWLLSLIAEVIFLIYCFVFHTVITGS